MKSLLIIGAGEHGNVVAETAEACGYTIIDFIDDKSEKAIGRVADLKRFRDQYDRAFVGIGNNIIRDKLIEELLALGYEVPILIHPTAYVSKSAVIHEGTIVEPNAIVNTNSIIGRGGIISVGAIIDHNVILGKATHVNSGAIVSPGGVIDDFMKIESGEVVMGCR